MDIKMLKLVRRLRTPNLWLFVFSLMVSLALAGQSDVIGTWRCVSNDTPIGNLTWTMTIKDEEGKLAGTMACDELGTFRLSELKLDGDDFAFVFYPAGNHVTVKTKLQERKLIGTWQIDAGPGGEFRGDKTPGASEVPGSQ